MASALSIGTTGLMAASKGMDVVANNLANSNTVGYKTANTYFSNLLNQNLNSSGSMSVGQGVAVSSISNQFAQGTFEGTGNVLDMAIDGEGFFIVKDTSTGALYYTRNGNFHVDAEGYLVDSRNYRVQGYDTFLLDSGDVLDQMTDIRVQNIQSEPKATTEVSFGVNLNEQDKVGTKFVVSQTVFDSKGAMHTLSVVFQKTEEAGHWSFDSRLDGNKSVMADYSGVKFDQNGKMESLYMSDVTTQPTPAELQGATMVINAPGQIYKDSTAPLVFEKLNSTGAWAVVGAGTPAAQNGGYENVIAWEVNGNLYVDLDGKGGADITFEGGAWVTGNTLSFELGVTTGLPLQDLTFYFDELDNDATIGVQDPTLMPPKILNLITWDLEGETAQEITGYAAPSIIKSLRDNGYSSGV
ncbi:MAG: flagellar hook-basal body complex protein, partial [Syntrophaceae bacterium]|nr:flagellar hook-basal body complex protein [Syntrophaceae bacterium]